MKRYMYAFAAPLLLLCSLLSSCSNDKKNDEKGIIEQQTDKMGQEAVHALKSPLDQAKKAAEQENTHNRQMEEEVKKQ
jgi:hypothetical protein